MASEKSKKILSGKRFITGDGEFLDDINVDTQLYAYFLRSSMAHAKYTINDIKMAKKMSGVIAVYTIDDLIKVKLNQQPAQLFANTENRNNAPFICTDYSLIAENTVKYVGDIIAMVIAKTAEQAQSAAEYIDVHYEPLSVNTNLKAKESDITPIWPQIKNNIAFDWEAGNKEAVAKIMKKAAYVVECTLTHNRVIPCTMEPRGAIAKYEQKSKNFTLWASNVKAHLIKKMLCHSKLNISENKLRVITPDVGGSFGTKLFCYREFHLLLFAARELKTSIKWVSSRLDSFISDTHGRDHITTIKLALDNVGKFLALDIKSDANVGAYLSNGGNMIPTIPFSRGLTGLYDISVAYINVVGHYTNMVPVDAYRGAGRPESAYQIERIVDIAAKKLNLSPDKIRQINFIQPNQLPYANPIGTVIDSGNFDAHLEKAKKIANWNTFITRKKQSNKQGKLRGIGLSSYVEFSPGNADYAEIEVNIKGSIQLNMGGISSGQSHNAMYANIAANYLGISRDCFHVKEGDTKYVADGAGQGGSQALSVGGNALMSALEKLVAIAKSIMADHLKIESSHIKHEKAMFIADKTQMSLSLFDIARLAIENKLKSNTFSEGLIIKNKWSAKAPTFPNGTHIVEVEIDIDTGALTIQRWTGVDDLGNILNLSFVDAQIHGGIAQGVGQAIIENCVYDVNGQLITGSYIDYALPRADDFPMFTLDKSSYPCKTNPLGVKGVGEVGTIAAPPALINAIVNALQEYNVEHIDMPVTSEKLWRIIHASK